MKIMAINPVNHNQKINAQLENSGKNPSFGMKVNLNTDLLKLTLVQKREPAAIEVLNKMRDFVEKLNETTKNSSIINTTNIFKLAMQKLEVPKSKTIESMIPDFQTRELNVGIEQPHSGHGLKVSIYDGKKSVDTFVTYDNLKSASGDPHSTYKSVIIHGLIEYAKKALNESPLYRQYLQSSEHTQYIASDEFKSLQAPKK